MRETGIAVSCPIRPSAIAATISEGLCQQFTSVPHAFILGGYRVAGISCLGPHGRCASRKYVRQEHVVSSHIF